jgi:HD-GYP domain-containing protein (c-di-GMP phosphodiesterase class II)
MDAEGFHDELLKLTEIGIALTSMHNLDELLEMIVREARGFTSADAGSLYLREGEHLRFAVSQNDTLKERLGPEGERALFSPFTVPINEDSISGYVAATKQNLNIPDVHIISDESPYDFNPDFDDRNNYRSQSMLTVPMVDRWENVHGVLQLINATQDGRVVPFVAEQERLVRSLASQAAVAVNNARLTAEIKQVHLDTIYRLSVAAEYKDKDTAQHIRRMSHYSAALARKLGWSEPEVELILYASPMHDVGKIGIPDAILLKPGRLTDEERSVMQDHTTIGARIMAGSDSELLRLSEEVALTHHEKWDGTGYPRNLKGVEISKVGRIVAVADVFDALSSKRVYKGAMGLEESLEIIQKDAGTHFDPESVTAFSEIMDEVRGIHDRYTD